MKCIKWLGAIVVIFIGSIAALSAVFPSATVRHRLTLETAIGGEPAIGSGVIEVSYRKNPQFLGAQSEIAINVRGEAVAVDLGSHGVLFALLKAGRDPRSGVEYLVLRAFGMPSGVPRPVEQGLAQIRSLNGKVVLPIGSLPTLVRFSDVDDPTTAERVDPEDFAKTFGPAAKFIRATVEIVPTGRWPWNRIGISGEAITTGIDNRLVWLNAPELLKGPLWDWRDPNYDYSNGLKLTDFKRGL